MTEPDPFPFEFQTLTLGQLPGALNSSRLIGLGFEELYGMHRINLFIVGRRRQLCRAILRNPDHPGELWHSTRNEACQTLIVSGLSHERIKELDVGQNLRKVHIAGGNDGRSACGLPKIATLGGIRCVAIDAFVSTASVEPEKACRACRQLLLLSRERPD